MTMTPEFSFRGYTAMIKALQTKGYKVVGFDALCAERAHLVLRHDIDMSLAAAAELAELERDLGLRAHYFVLVASEFYNVFTTEAGALLRRIAEAGHAIGLHFDVGERRGAALDAAAACELAALEAVLDQPVRMISLHRPRADLVGYAQRIAGRPHTYEPRFVHKIGYCSDSQGGWHRGDPLSHPAVAAGTALQLLTHPIWWVGDPAPPEARLDRFLLERAARLDRELAEQCGIHVAGRLFAKRDEQDG